MRKRESRNDQNLVCHHAAFIYINILSATVWQHSAFIHSNWSTPESTVCFSASLIQFLFCAALKPRVTQNHILSLCVTPQGWSFDEYVKFLSLSFQKVFLYDVNDKIPKISNKWKRLKNIPVSFSGGAELWKWTINQHVSFFLPTHSVREVSLGARVVTSSWRCSQRSHYSSARDKNLTEQFVGDACATTEQVVSSPLD